MGSNKEKRPAGIKPITANKYPRGKPTKVDLVLAPRDSPNDLINSVLSSFQIIQASISAIGIKRMNIIIICPTSEGIATFANAVILILSHSERL